MTDHNNNGIDLFMRMFAGPTLTDMFMDSILQGAASFDLRAIYNRALEAAPDGRGQPVLVIPGFSHDDSHTREMRKFITENNYDVHALAYEHKNYGPTPEILEHLEKRIEEISRAHHGRKVALVGHSLGGMFAEAMARKRPELVSKVVTLGSPIHASGDNQTIYKFSQEIKSILGLSAPLQVPLASIRASHDGVLGLGLDCLGQGEKRWDDIRIDTSHLGLLCHPSAMVAVLDRLAQPSRSWKPFDRDVYPEFKFLDESPCIATPARAPKLAAA
jgi:pimeloyl-ACP methyl ester carboxylesterase